MALRLAGLLVCDSRDCLALRLVIQTMNFIGYCRGQSVHRHDLRLRDSQTVIGGR